MAASLDDVVDGFQWAWNGFVAGTLKPTDFLKRPMGVNIPSDQKANQMGRRLAAEKYHSLKRV